MEINTINIAIADDHPIVRRGLSDFIISFGGFNVIMEASNGIELLDKMQEATVLPDICILDISMPNLNGYETLKKIKKNWSAVKVLVFSAFCDVYSVSEMLNNGANGFLKKNSSPKQLQQALAMIYYNDYYLTESMAKNLLLKSQTHNLHNGITEREMEFLKHCCSELSYKDIAKLMGISARSIETFRDSLFDKLSTKTRAGLVMFAFQNGIVSFD